MKTFITLFFLSLSLFIHSQENIDLFIWAGQSNALGLQGDATQYPPDVNNLDTSIRFNWDVPNGGDSGGWTTMGPQDLGHYFPDGHFGPEVTFSRKLVQAGYNPAIFKFTQGGTSIFEHWLNPGNGGLYDDMVASLNTAILDLENQGHTVTIKGFVWIQGESDSNTQAAASAYFNNLTILLNDIRTNVVDNATLPIILGVDEQYFNSTGHEQPEIVNAHESIALADENIKFTSMYGYPKADVTHLTPAGLISHGEDLFDSYELLVSHENPVSNCTLISNGTIISTVPNPILWGQSFSTDCSGMLNSITFSAAEAVNDSFTFTLHNGLDCSADILATQTLNTIVEGDNIVSFPGDLYLDKEHTYYFNIVSDANTVWQIRYNNSSNVNGHLKTFTNGEGATSCSRNFYNFDMDFSVDLITGINNSCILSSSGSKISFERASWGQSFSTNCSGSLNTIKFSAASSPNEPATFTLYDGDDCNATVLYTQTLSSINVGNNTVTINNGLTLDENNMYFFQVVSETDELWRIHYSDTDLVDGMLHTYQNDDYCERTFPSFDMNFSVEIEGSSQCADEANIYSFEYDNRTYEIVKENKTWVEAAACAVERGGKLVEINDQAEQDVLFDELQNNANITVANTVSPDGGNASYVWIGANDLATEGLWIWDGNNDTNGVQFWQGGPAAQGGVPVGGLYSNWGNEPDDWNNQNTAGIALTQWPVNTGTLGSAGQWNDVDQNNMLYYIIEYSSLVGTANENLIDTLILYPNPVKDILTIKDSQFVIKQIRIYNIQGQIIKTIQSKDTSRSKKIDLSSFTTGVYFVEITYENGKAIVRRIIK